MWTHFVAVLVLVGRAASQDVECVRKSTCSCKMSDESGVINLSPLQANNKDEARFVVYDDHHKYGYAFNPCHAFNDENGCSVDDDVAVCQRAPGGHASICGLQGNATFTVDQATKEVNVSFQQGTGGRSSSIKLVCNEAMNDSAAVWSFLGENPRLHYNFRFESKCCCPDGCPFENGGISAGSILVIVFFGLITVYFVAGILVMKFKSGAQGKEMIPNVSFWASLPGLVKDGFLFVFQKCRRGGSSGSVNYETLQ
ncbi:uncharacterized protein [Oscarella lobularis]|uniref:uncharacterized protein n=1 Tax=Oscarella lobularis TaxID=121494 RepID=UPI00331420C2